MFKDNLLAGKRVLVTGGGTGLGRSITQRYMSLGAHVVICGRREDVLRNTVAELGVRPGKHRTYKMRYPRS